RRNPARRPADRVLDLRERPRPIGSRGETVEKLPHEVAAAVVEAGDLVGIAKGVPRRVLAKRGWALDAGHPLSIEGSEGEEQHASRAADPAPGRTATVSVAAIPAPSKVVQSRLRLQLERTAGGADVDRRRGVGEA